MSRWYSSIYLGKPKYSIDDLSFEYTIHTPSLAIDDSIVQINSANNTNLSTNLHGVNSLVPANDTTTTVFLRG